MITPKGTNERSGTVSAPAAGRPARRARLSALILLLLVGGAVGAQGQGDSQQKLQAMMDSLVKVAEATGRKA